MNKVLLAIPDRCTGCSRCVYACSAEKEGRFIPSQGRIHISQFSLEGYSVPHICFQCANPGCLPACPAGAIYRNEQNVLLVDEEKCSGCGDCVNACPYGMIQQDPRGLAYKCDSCGGDPACVKECYPRAIVFEEGDKDLVRLRNLQMEATGNGASPEEKRHGLGLKILAEARGRRGAISSPTGPPENKP